MWNLIVSVPDQCLSFTACIIMHICTHSLTHRLTHSSTRSLAHFREFHIKQKYPIVSNKFKQRQWNDTS